MESGATVVIDGGRFDTLEGFWDEVSRVLVPGNVSWGRNLDALRDVLRGGFGTPDTPYRLVWRDAAKSRRDLGYGETARQLELRLGRAHPDNHTAIQAELAAARRGEGPTVFDWLRGIFDEADGVELVLE
jgi:RNAse (barnase) inhibitor barstar